MFDYGSQHVRELKANNVPNKIVLLLHDYLTIITSPALLGSIATAKVRWRSAERVHDKTSTQHIAEHHLVRGEGEGQRKELDERNW